MSTSVIAVIAQKGGSGKTTTAIGLAVAAAGAGKAAVIIDLDPQANASNWRDRRQADNPAVVAAPPSRLRQTIETARAHGAEYIVIDTPGKLDSATVEAARVADLVLVPAAPHIFHLETLPTLRDLLRVAGNPPTFVILNPVHPQATVQSSTAKLMIRRTFEFEVCPVHLCRRDIYADTMTTGVTPLEAEPGGRAADELTRLYEFTIQQINKSDSPHVEETTVAPASANDSATKATRLPELPQAVEPIAATHGPSRPRGRDGQVNISAWMDPAFKTSLRLVQAHKGPKCELQELMTEALNDLFAKYDVPTVRQD